MTFHDFFLKHRKTLFLDTIKSVPWIFFSCLIGVQIILLLNYFDTKTPNVIWVNFHIFVMILKTMPIVILAVMLHGGWVLWDKENKQNRSDK